MYKILPFLFCVATAQLKAQCVAINNCPTGTPKFCNQAPNAPEFWNESYWTLPNGSTDLPEVTVTLSLKATNNCAGQSLSFRYLLFLDTDADGLQETVINSANLPGFNTVYYNNINNPNYSGGIPRAFDERSVASNQLYGFALETTTNGSSSTAYLRWNTMAAPAVFVDPLLPAGTHRLKWFVSNNLGEEKTCEYSFQVQKDCTPPTVVCKNNLIINVLPTQMLQLFDVDFVAFVQDNVTPSNELITGIRITGTGSGFPFDSLGNPKHSLTYNCADLGINFIEIWAMDEAGNADFCSTYFTLEDFNGHCPPVGTSQPEQQIDFEIRLQPNPFSSELQLYTARQKPGSLVINLTDATGRTYYHESPTLAGGEQTFKLPVEALAPGIYFLRVTDAKGGVYTQKLMKYAP